jgi:hypothetical protein
MQADRETSDEKMEEMSERWAKVLHYKEGKIVGLAEYNLIKYPSSRSRTDVKARKEYTEDEWFGAQVISLSKRSASLCTPLHASKAIFHSSVPEHYRVVRSRAVLDMMVTKDRLACTEKLAGKFNRRFRNTETRNIPSISLEKPVKVDLEWFDKSTITPRKNTFFLFREEIARNLIVHGPDISKMETTKGFITNCNRQDNKACKGLLASFLDMDEVEGAKFIVDNTLKISTLKGTSWNIPGPLKRRVIDGILSDQFLGDEKSSLKSGKNEHWKKMISFLGTTVEDNEMKVHVNKEAGLRIASIDISDDVMRKATKSLFSRYRRGKFMFPDSHVEFFWGKKEAENDREASVISRRKLHFAEYYPSKLMLSCESMEKIRADIGGVPGLHSTVKRFREKINRKYNKQCK